MQEKMMKAFTVTMCFIWNFTTCRNRLL